MRWNKSPPPTTALQIAFTAPGLKELGLPDSVMEGFSREFRTGMSNPPQITARGCWVTWVVTPPSIGIGAAPGANHISW